MREATKAALDNILDTFSGADGLGRYIRFQSLLIGLDRQAEGGDADAQQLIDVMARFSRLIDVAQKEP